MKRSGKERLSKVLRELLTPRGERIEWSVEPRRNDEDHID